MTDGSEKRRIIQRLIRKINVEDLTRPADDYITTAAKYTGLHPEVLKKLETCATFEAKIEPIDRSIIYEKLVHFYAVKKKIPCTYELFDALQGEIPPYVDIETFRKTLVRMDFVWKKVSPTAAVVIEKPLVRFERFSYLKKMQFLRKSNLDIYFIDDNAYDISGFLMDSKLSDMYLLSQGQQTAWVQRIIYAVGSGNVHFLDEIKSFTTEEVANWVRDTVCPKINKPSVFVLSNAKHHNGKLMETPTLNSLKSEIMPWLDRNEVPYDSRMSKYELYALAEKYTDMETTLFKIDEILKVNGHTVVRVPRCIHSLTPSALLYKVVNEIVPPMVHVAAMNNNDAASNTLESHKSLFSEMLVSAGVRFLQEFNVQIVEQEEKLLHTEMELDKIYDVLISKANNTKPAFEDSDVPSCSDSE